LHKEQEDAITMRLYFYFFYEYVGGFGKSIN